MKTLFLIPLMVCALGLFAQKQSYKPKEFKNITFLGKTRPLIDIDPIHDPRDRVIDRKEMHHVRPHFVKDQSRTPGILVKHDFVKNETIPILENFEGVGAVDMPNPDTEGYVGSNHYMQIVKNRFAIWDKSGNLLYGPAENKTLWSDFPGPWHDQHWTDPIVVYDHLNDRWLASAMIYEIDIEYHIMIAVSATPDPLGEWNCYAMWFADMPDYPKFGIWPDGYYLSVNEVDVINYWGYLTGPSIFVFKQEDLISGVQDPTIIYFHIDATYQNMLEDIASFMPSDLDGNPPPPGTPNYHICMRDDAWGWEQDRLWIWEALVDWEDTSNCHFSEVAVLETLPFDSNIDTADYIVQPGGNKLQSLSQFLMYRQQFRSFGEYQSIVVNHTVKVPGTQQSGIRWYELRDEGNGWYIHQENTYAPDDACRWMGSIAMDKDGNIGLGYSVSSNSIFPSIYVAGRNYNDDISQMTFEESEVIAGTASQILNPRWGDYSCLTVDPIDDQTFWYTQQYIDSTGALVWKTRINSFQLQKNLSFFPDSIIFMTYDECLNGKSIVIKNTSQYSVSLTAIEQEGWFGGALWELELSGGTVPVVLNPGDSMECMVYIGFETNQPSDNLLVDWISCETDYKIHNVAVCLNEDLVTNLEHNQSQMNKIHVYPNPFNASIMIDIQLKSQSWCSVYITDLEQKKVCNLLNDQNLNPGKHQFFWDGNNSDGKGAASGVYHVHFEVNEKKLLKKVIKK